MFKCWGNFFENFFCPVFHGGSSLRNVLKNLKNFQNCKAAENRSQSVQKCFEHVLGYLLRKFFLPSVPWRVESSKCFQKIKKFSKFHKCPKLFPKVPNVFWTCFCVIFPNDFFAQCSMEGRVFEMFLKKFKKIQNCKNT